MPFSFQVSKIARRACMRAEGAVDIQSSLAAGYRLAGDGRIGTGFRILVDMRGSSWNPSSEEAMDLATAAAQIPMQDSKLALLVSPGGVGPAGVFRELAAAYGLAVQMFERSEEAHAWLQESRQVH